MSATACNTELLETISNVQNILFFLIMSYIMSSPLLAIRKYKIIECCHTILSKKYIYFFLQNTFFTLLYLFILFSKSLYILSIFHSFIVLVSIIFSLKMHVFILLCIYKKKSFAQMLTFYLLNTGVDHLRDLFT